MGLNVLVTLETEPKALSMLGKCSSLSCSPVLSPFSFETVSASLPGWSQTCDPPVAASQVDKISRVSHYASFKVNIYFKTLRTMKCILELDEIKLVSRSIELARCRGEAKRLLGLSFREAMDGCVPTASPSSSPFLSEVTKSCWSLQTFHSRLENFM